MKLKIAALGFALIGIVAAAVPWYAINQPMGGEPLVFEVASGDRLRTVLDRLADRLGPVDRLSVRLVARATGQTSPKVGEYRLSPDETPRMLLERLNKGEVLLHTLTIVEGWNRWQVRDHLAEHKWITPQAFDILCDDKAFLAGQKIPGPTCDGYVFPDTYTLARGGSTQSLFKMFFEAHRAAYREVLSGLKGKPELDHRQFMTLASIVEEETGAAEERPRIACVFYNRLHAKPMWKLQTDPTVIYSMRLQKPDFDGNIRRSHLRANPHPYNTYHIRGLPPGPITNPGIAAMQAVAKPETCPYFFFVSMNNGKHVFCDTLACHNRAVDKWQIRYFAAKKKR